MPANVLQSFSTVRVAEDVEDKLYNFRPDDSPLISSIERMSVSNTFHEWQRDSYATPDPNNAAIEGADAANAVIAQPGPLNNRTQIFTKSFSIAGTTEAVKKYGRKTELARTKGLRLVEIRRDMEAAVLSSGAAVTAGGATAGKLRGLYGFLTNGSVGATGVAPDPTTNTAPTAGTLRPLTEALVKSAVLSNYNNGGNSSVLYCSPTHKQVLSSVLTGGVTKMQDINGEKAPTIVANVDFYRNDYSITAIVPNRVMTNASYPGLVSTVYIGDLDKMALGQLRPLQTKNLAETGDAENWQMLTEVTLIVRDEKPMAAIRDITIAGT